jgi:hypothetical protein
MGVLIETPTEGVAAEHARLCSFLTTGGSGLVTGYDRCELFVDRR